MMNRSALDLTEESVRLLQKQSAFVWLQYLSSAVPFLLALLTFQHDMTVGYNASRCGGESLLCAVLFFWLNFCKARFSGSLLSALSGEEACGKRSRFVRCFLFQAIVQATKLICLPLAAVAIAPFPWVSAFYRSAAIEADRARSTLSDVLRKSSKHASFAPKQNWITLLLTAAIGFVVLVNILLLLLLLPELTRALTGSESDWTRNAAHVLNWQTFLEAVTLTWFVLDPFLQALTVVRCFYAEARYDGRDLLAYLRQIAALALLSLLIGPAFIRLQAAEPPHDTPSVSQAELDRGVEEALKGSEYRWRLAREEDGNFLQSFTHRLGTAIDAALEHVDSWFQAFGRWLRKLLDRNSGQKASPERPIKPDRTLPWIVGSLAGVIALALVIAMVRKRLQQSSDLSTQAGEPLEADLSDGNLLATEIPEDEWLRLAKEYAGKGELRLAIRAMYLSSLASLGQRQLIAVTRWKSNRLYERELQIRSRAGELREAFASSNRDYERAWFGLHEVTNEQIQRFEERLQAIRAYGTS